MDFSKFNKKRVTDRDVDTLIGLSKGLTADGKVDQAEAEFLLSWLVQSKSRSDNPLIENLLLKIEDMLSDGHLDDDESAELLAILNMVSGDQSELGELAKASTLPLCSPVPDLIFQDHSFLFTGTFAYGNRKACQAATESLGGRCAGSVNKNLHYLVIGSYVTDSWKHESFGNKIMKAVQYREDGVPISIISEEHWLELGRFS